MSQSGGLGLAALALFTGPSLGVSSFVSVGNTADLTRTGEDGSRQSEP